jgi:hypothetical protein
VSPDGGLPSAFPANGDGLCVSAFRGPSKNRRVVRNPFEALEPAAAPDSPFGTHPPSGWKADSQESFLPARRPSPQSERPRTVEKSFSWCQLAGLAARVRARRGGLRGPASLAVRRLSSCPEHGTTRQGRVGAELPLRGPRAA